MNNWIWKILFVFSLLMVTIGGWFLLNMLDDDNDRAKGVAVHSSTDMRFTPPVVPIRSVNRMPSVTRNVPSGTCLRRPVVRSSTTLFHHNVSSAVTRSYNGSIVGNAGTSAGYTAKTTSSSTVKPESYTITPVVFPVNSPLAVVGTVNKSSFAAPRKAPGTGGVKTQWETWLDEWEADGHDRNDPTGLEEWWYQNYGDGANPDIFGDFYNYYFGVPLADGISVLILMAILYCIIRKGIVLRYND